MNGSLGQALQQARMAKKLSIEEVAHATKIRSDRILDMEADNYIHFPNVAYARSFLVLYAKHLGIDISRYPTIEVGSAVSMNDYQYLHEAEGAAPSRFAPALHAESAEKPRWLVFFFVFLAMALLGIFLGWSFITINRLGPGLANSADPAGTASPATPAASPAPPEDSANAASPAEGTPQTVAPSPAEQQESPAPLPSPAPSPTPSPAPAPALSPEEPAPALSPAPTPEAPQPEPSPTPEFSMGSLNFGASSAPVSVVTSTPEPAPTPAEPEPQPEPQPPQPESQSPVVEQPAPQPSPEKAVENPSSASATPPVEEVRRAEPVDASTPSGSPTPAPTPTPAPERIAIPERVAVPEVVAPATAEAPPRPVATPTASPAASAREVRLTATQKTRLRVVRDVPTSSPLYTGALSPYMEPLVFQGRRFWIKVTEPEALRLFVNGQPVDVRNAAQMGVDIQQVPKL